MRFRYLQDAHVELVAAPKPLKSLKHEAILLVGLPGAGQMGWAASHMASHGAKRHPAVALASC